jgi:hypothetical protein
MHSKSSKLASAYESVDDVMNMHAALCSLYHYRSIYHPAEALLLPQDKMSVIGLLSDSILQYSTAATKTITLYQCEPTTALDEPQPDGA